MSENLVNGPEKSTPEPTRKRPGRLPYGKGKLPNWSSRNSLWTWIIFGMAVILSFLILLMPHQTQTWLNDLVSVKAQNDKPLINPNGVTIIPNESPGK